MTLPNSDDWPRDGNDPRLGDRSRAELALEPEPNVPEPNFEPNVPESKAFESKAFESKAFESDVASNVPVDCAVERTSAPHSPEALTPNSSDPPRSPRSRSSLSLFLGTRPLWQVVLGLGIGAIGLTSLVIGVFALSGLALQGLGRAVANLIAGVMVLALFGSFPAAFILVAIQTLGIVQQRGVSAGTAKLVIGVAIGLGIAIGLLGRQ